jgi:putative transposase
MVHRELWTTILAYNLIRTTAAAAALLHHKQPRQISFTSTCQYVLASWMQLSSGLIAPAILRGYLWLMLQQISACEVGEPFPWMALGVRKLLSPAARTWWGDSGTSRIERR